jgi:hypothetical protein
VDVFKDRLNKMDTADFEVNWEKSEVVAEQQDVPKEDDAVETIDYRITEGLIWGPASSLGRRWQPKKRAQGDGGSQQKLAAAHRRMTRRATPASRKVYYRQVPGKDKAESKV